VAGVRREPLAVAAIALLASEGSGSTQTSAPTNALPNPYRSIENWAKMPDGRVWGSTSGVDIDRDGRSVWVAERCGVFAAPSQMKPGVPFACDGSQLDPEIRRLGKLV
jgi:hypothetical protein